MAIDSGTTSQLTAMWGSASDDIWAVGFDGTTVHWDGVGWTPVENPASEDLLSVWGVAPDDVWAVGGGQMSARLAGEAEDRNGVVIHWDGESWNVVENPSSGPLFGVWGTANAVWVAGEIYPTPVVYRRNEGAWQTVAIDPRLHEISINGLWGAADDDIWAVGSGGILMHWDGTVWAGVDSETKAELHGVWGTGTDNVWAFGGGATALHFDGKNWLHIPCPSSAMKPPVCAVWGTATDDMWLVDGDRFLYHWDGARCVHKETIPLRAPRALWSSGNNKMWIGGWSPEMLIRDV